MDFAGFLGSDPLLLEFDFMSVLFLEHFEIWADFFANSESVWCLEEFCDEDDSESLVVEESEPLEVELELEDPDEEPVVDSVEDPSWKNVLNH